jgi:hypothetical protein
LPRLFWRTILRVQRLTVNAQQLLLSHDVCGRLHTRAIYAAADTILP